MIILVYGYKNVYLANLTGGIKHLHRAFVYCVSYVLLGTPFFILE